MSLWVPCCIAWAQVSLPGGLTVLPHSASVTHIEGTVSIQGVPARMLAFQTPMQPQQLAQQYVNEWKAVATPQADQSIVLGKQSADHFITVKLTPTPGGTRGLMSIIDTRQIASASQASAQRIKAWTEAFGPQALLVDHAVSEVAGTRNESLLLALQTSPTQALRQAQMVLKRRGYQTDQSFTAEANPAARGRTDDALVTTFHKDGGHEAVVTAFRHRDGKSYIKVDTITHTASH
ncbi:hypothetical protein EYS42_07095 [Aquabacterium lacunae]|uniref:Uncharacterized protein n=1 Tax=Aquabacterium lacunae TaxID=2528630 RepID=A0A4Q9H162_9BURK|nr:hypothetical protein EYS42_07095 [Aquabacterium lacunae]